MKRETAKEVLQFLNDAANSVLEALMLLKAELPPDEFNVYNRESLPVLDGITRKMMEPICHEYPELDPAKGDPN